MADYGLAALALADRVALVTGAGQGVGAGVAHALARHGATVAVNDLDLGRAQATAQSIVSAGGRALAVPFDVSQAESVATGVARIHAEAGPIDVLVNNAGKGGQYGIGQASFRSSSPRDWDGPLAVDYRGVLLCTRAVIDGMCDRHWGRVISIASDAGTIGMPIGVSAYGAAKGAVIALMRHIAVETGPEGVTANSIALGHMVSPEPSDYRRSVTERVPARRLGAPEDVGHLCAYLASPGAAWMTGQTIHLNGGEVTT